MKKFLIVMAIMLATTTAQGKGYMGLNGGAGPNGGNIGIEIGGVGELLLFGVGFGGIMSGDRPDDVNDYPCPHNYVTDGTYYRDDSEGEIHVKMGPRIGDNGVVVFGLAGMSVVDEDKIQQDLITKEFHVKESRKQKYGFLGAGIGYFPPNSMLTLQLEADNRRGVVFGVGFKF